MRDLIVERLTGETGNPDHVLDTARACAARCVPDIAGYFEETLNTTVEVELGDIEICRMADVRLPEGSFGAMVVATAEISPDALFMTLDAEAITIAVGALLGVLVTVSSVGAGALGVAVLFYLYPRLPTIRIIGSDVAHAVPLTLVAGLGQWLLGSIDWSLLGSLLLGSLPGIWLGSHASAKIPDRILRPILACMLLLIGGKLIAQ